MAKLFNRVKVNTATTGTGTVTLGAATANNFCTFAEGGVANLDVVAYVIEDGTDFECGIGTYTSAGTTLSRTTVRLSKIGGTAGTSKISLSGAAVVFLSPHQEDLQSKSETQTAKTFWGGPSSGAAAAPAFRALLGSDLPMGRRTISSADTMVASDQGGIVEVTSGTFSLAFSPAATLGSGWWAIISNPGSGNVTLDPDSAEQIDGATSWILYPGGTILVQCTGSALESYALSGMRVQFDASGTLTKPLCAGLSNALLEAIGGGASGGKGRSAATTAGGGGGAGGGYSYKNTPISSLGTTETITIGAGGASQTVDSTAGTAGGNTTIGALLTGYGGGAGFGSGGSGSQGGGGGGGGMTSAGTSSTGVSGGAGGGPLTGTVAIAGFGGGAGGAGSNGTSSGYGGGGAGGGSNNANSQAGNGGNSVYGGGGGGGSIPSGGAGSAGTGGTSLWAGNGGAGSGPAGGNGVNGTAPGGGGGGTFAGNSGAGADGRAIITFS